MKEIVQWYESFKTSKAISKPTKEVKPKVNRKERLNRLKELVFSNPKLTNVKLAELVGMSRRFVGKHRKSWGM